MNRVLVVLVILSLVLSACSTSSSGEVDPEAAQLVEGFQTQTAEAGPAVATQERRPSSSGNTNVEHSLEALPARYMDEGRYLTVENDSVRVVFDKDWGGAIREIWYGGENSVNNYDGGRLIAVSFYDGATTEGNTDHPADTGWNPTPSDWLNNSNAPLEYSFSDNTLYIKTRYIQWFPLDKGGGEGDPVATEVIVETWFSFVNDQQLMHVRYKITYQGNEPHVLAQQEFPFAYVRSPFDRFVTYSGAQPWQNGEVQISDVIPVFPDYGDTKATEYWGGFVNENDIGLLLYAPQNYPATTYNDFDNQPPAENSCFYMLPYAFFQLEPGLSKEINAFFYAGNWRNAREQFYALESSTSFPDILPPLGFMDSLVNGATVSGTVDVAGWAFDDEKITSVNIYLDGTRIGSAQYGHARPDVANANPSIPGAAQSGYVFSLDTTEFSNGTHELLVELVDVAGNRSVAQNGEITLTIRN